MSRKQDKDRFAIQGSTRYNKVPGSYWVPLLMAQDTSEKSHRESGKRAGKQTKAPASSLVPFLSGQRFSRRKSCSKARREKKSPTRIGQTLIQKCRNAL